MSNTTLRRALAATALAWTLALPLPTHAFFCTPPIVCLLSPLCCPRPCPVRDWRRISMETTRVAQNDYIEDAMAEEATQLATLITRLGRSGARARTAHPCEQAYGRTMHLELARRAAGIPAPDSGYARAGAALSEATLADMSDALLYLSGAIATAQERLSAARELLYEARDVRDVLARMGEIATLVRDIDEIQRIANAAALRLKSAGHVRGPLRTP